MLYLHTRQLYEVLTGMAFHLAWIGKYGLEKNMPILLNIAYSVNTLICMESAPPPRSSILRDACIHPCNIFDINFF